MCYLHGNGIIHGDLRGVSVPVLLWLCLEYFRCSFTFQANILIDDHGNPKLIDFGLSVLQGAGYNTLGTKPRGAGTVRFMAPELLAEEGGESSFQTDIYAFACVCIEVRPEIVMLCSIKYLYEFLSCILGNTHSQISLGTSKSPPRFCADLVQVNL